MARVLPDTEELPVATWRIRCAQAVSGYMSGRAVEGCFRMIEVEAIDFHAGYDGEGDALFHVQCPNCGLTLYPSWQMAGVTVPQLKRAQAVQKAARGKV